MNSEAGAPYRGLPNLKRGAQLQHQGSRQEVPPPEAALILTTLSRDRNKKLQKNFRKYVRLGNFDSLCEAKPWQLSKGERLFCPLIPPRIEAARGNFIGYR